MSTMSTDNVVTPTTAHTTSTKRERSVSIGAEGEERSNKRINRGNDGLNGNGQDSEENDNGGEGMVPAQVVVKAESNGVGADGVSKMDVDEKPAVGSSLPRAPESLPPTPAPPGSAGTSSQPPSSATGSGHSQGPQIINMRCLIVTQDASVIIGKQGKHINEIRGKSGARVNISESIAGNPERILSVQGALDASAKAFGLIVRRINDEPFDQPSLPGSRPVTIKFMIPHSRMGSVIGKGGQKIKEIQEASGARLNASEQMLPGSTERILSIAGVADAVHIAVYYVGAILLEFAERTGPAGSGNTSGQYRQVGSGAGVGAPRQQANMMPSPGVAVQQFWIPNDLVGSIIGRAGVKINEVRSQSQCQIRVTDPGTPATPGGPVNPNERLVIISGHPQHMNIAIGILHQRLEAEKAKKAQAEAEGGTYAGIN